MKSFVIPYSHIDLLRNASPNVDLGVLYGHLILYVKPASMHCKFKTPLSWAAFWIRNWVLLKG